MVPQIISKGKIIRPGLGITLANPRLTEELGLDGGMILKVLPGSSAEKAGLRGTTQVREGLVLGDVIVAVNGKKTRDYDSFRDALERFEVGQDVTLTLLRDAATVDVQVTLEAMQ